MKVHNEKISQSFLNQLSDWEIISAFSYTKMLIKKEDFLAKEHFEDISFFFFDGDEKLANEYLSDISEVYINTYFNRHLN